MTADMQQLHIFLVFVLALFLSCALTTEDNDANTEEGYCSKTEEGIKCLSNDDMMLTRLDSLQVGEVREIDVQGRKLQIKTTCIKPLIFEIQNFLDDEECEHLIDTAKAEGLFNSQTEKMSDDKKSKKFQLLDDNNDRRLSLSEMKATIENAYDMYLDEEDILQMYQDLDLDFNEDKYITPDEITNIKPSDLQRYLKDFIQEHPEKHSRYSRQVWMSDDSGDQIFENIQKRVSTAVQLPLDLIRLSDFQIVDYSVKGHYNAHLDSSEIIPHIPCCDKGRVKNCRICRYMTILFYLNDVEEGGETAFPVANNETLDLKKVHRDGLMHLYKRCSDANLRVLPEKGKAVIWYNHLINKETGWMGDLDPYTVHGGCPVIKGEKWIGNFWIKATDNKDNDLERMKKFYT